MAQMNALMCNKTFLGTGLTDCEPIQVKEFNGAIFTPNSWSISATELATWTQAKVRSLIQQTTFDPLFNAVSFTDNTPDATTEEFSGGIINTVHQGLPQYQMEFRNGLGFHKSAYSKNNNGGRRVILVDRAGNLYGAMSPDGTEFRGFSMSMFNTETYRPAAGDTGARTIVNLQLGNEQEFNARMVQITEESLGFSITDIQPIVSTKLTITAASVANGITLSVNGASNTVKGIEGLSADNFRVIDITDSTVEAIDSVSAGVTPGTYTLELDPALTIAHKVKVVLWDATATPPVATALDDATFQMFKGESNEFTVTA